MKIEQELEMISQLVEDKIFRDACNNTAQQIEYSFQQMFNDLKSHYIKKDVGGKKKVRGPTVQDKINKGIGSEEVLKNYVEDAIDALIKAHTGVQGMSILEQEPKKKLVVIAFEKNEAAAELFGKDDPTAGIAVGGTPYNALSQIKTPVFNGIVAKNQSYRDLFWEGKQLKGYDADGNVNKKAAGLDSTYSMGKAVNLGHVTGVTFEALTAMDNALPNQLEMDMSQSLEVQKDFEEVRKNYAKYRAKIRSYSLGTEHVGLALDFTKSGSDVVTVQADKFYLMGEGEKVNVGKLDEQGAKGVTGSGTRRMREQIAAFYEKHPYVKRSGSKSAMQKVRDALIANPKLRKATKSKAAKKWTRNKKQAPPRITKPIATKTADISRVKGQALNSTKGKARQPGALKSSGSGDSIASLAALLNQKLPQTVAKNMGPPGLENRTGRFAGSVRVTDVSRTPQGFPSVGYSYEKNPYQVFEMGRGDPRWATPDRDPRKLIDASMREIAAQLAIGRFYTRRI